MKNIEYTSCNSDKLTINGNEIEVINVFGNIYKGHFDENGKIVCKSRLGFGYILRAVEEYRMSNK